MNGLWLDAARIPANQELGQLWVTAPFTNSVLNDPDRPGEYALFPYQSGLGLPARDYYLDASAQFQDLRRTYLAYIATLLRLAGDVDAEQTAAPVMALETQLATAQWSAAESRNPGKTNNRVAIAQLHGVTDKVDWREYLQGAGHGGGGEKPSVFTSGGQGGSVSPAVPSFPRFRHSRVSGNPAGSGSPLSRG